MRRVALTPRKSPSQQRSAVLVDAIVEGAIRVLLKDGYGALTTIRVAERAGVSVGSLYQYFPNKQAIVAEIVRRRTAEIVAALSRSEMPCGASPASAVSALIDTPLIEKRREVALARALEPAMAEVEGRRTIMEAARGVVPELACKLGAAIGRSLTEQECANLAMPLRLSMEHCGGRSR